MSFLKRMTENIGDENLVASKNGTRIVNPAVRLGVEEDVSGLESAHQIMKWAVELVRLIKGTTN